MPVRNIPKMFVRSRLYGVQNKGTGALVENESELVGEDGSVYYRFIGGGFQIGATRFTSSGKTNSEKIVVPTRAPDATCELVTTPEQAHFYRLSGDYNPQHIDPDWEPVKVTGEAPILHGLCTLGHAARAVLQTYGGNDANRFHALKVRFSSPVIPGDTLLTKMWKLPEAEANKMINELPAACDRILFTTEVKSTGRVVVSNSFMDVLNPAGPALTRRLEFYNWSETGTCQAARRVSKIGRRHD